MYDLYGEGAVNKERFPLLIETIIGALSFYSIWSVFTFILTVSEIASLARAWSYVGVVILFIAEINLQFTGRTLPPKFFPYMTTFELIQLFRAGFPLYMNGCRSVCGYFNYNITEQTFRLGLELLKTNQVR